MPPPPPPVPPAIESASAPAVAGRGGPTFQRLASGWIIAAAVSSKTCGGSAPKAPERNAVPAGSVTGSRPSAIAASSTEAAVAGRGR